VWTGSYPWQLCAPVYNWRKTISEKFRGVLAGLSVRELWHSFSPRFFEPFCRLVLRLDPWCVYSEGLPLGLDFREQHRRVPARTAR